MVTAPLPPAVTYELAAGGRIDKATLERREQRDGTVLWGIFEDSKTCLVEPGCWTWESMPSSRTDEYLAMARRPFDEALELWRLHLLVACAGGTWRRQVAGSAQVHNLDRVYDPTGLVDRFKDVQAQPGGSLAQGSWIGEATAVLARTGEEPTGLADLAVEVDTTFRRCVALAGDAWRTRGVAEVTVATPSEFRGEAGDTLDKVFEEYGGADTLSSLRKDLFALLGGREALRVGYATLFLAGADVRARILPRDA